MAIFLKKVKKSQKKKIEPKAKPQVWEKSVYFEKKFQNFSII